MVEVSLESPWLFFVGVWWASVTFHLAMYLPMWMTKAGRWTDWIDG